MALSLNDLVPDFTLRDQNGASVTLSQLHAKGPVVLFFYPRDLSAGCTAEACAFRDSYQDFRQAGAEVVGISSQGVDSKKAFADKHHLPFVLVADTDGLVREKYGVKASFLGMVDGRETFVIDQQGKLRHRFNSQVHPVQHIAEALTVLRTIAPPPLGSAQSSSATQAGK